MPDPCCPCDLLAHPPKPDIPAGLARLPRQLAGFPEYRLAMLREIGLHRPLRDWRARQGRDFGLMLLEMWAYVLDVVGFYDERIANETYLRTALRRPSLRRLVELIGYLPRPALGSSVVLSAIGEGPQPSVLPAGSGFRSQAFDDEPPQIFESETEICLAPRQNEWTLAPVRETVPGPRLYLDPPTAGLTKDQLVLFRPATGSPSAGRLVDASPEEALDGTTYIRLRVDPPPSLGSSVDLAAVEVLAPSQRAHPNRSITSVIGESSWTLAVLDGLYPQIKDRDAVLVQRASGVRAGLVEGVGTVDVGVTAAVTVPATWIYFTPGLPTDWVNEFDQLAFHFHLVDAGRLIRPAKILLARDDVHGAALESPSEPLELDPPDALQLHDADDRGVQVDGSVAIDPLTGDGQVSLAQSEGEFSRALRTPVKVYGNLVAATRGESVFNEVIGSGDASQSFQSFALGKKPLTYFNDTAHPSGRRSTLEVRVNGLLWKEVPSFFGTAPATEVYIVRQNDDEESIVTFGDGVRGARLPSGVENVLATYRFGAGAAKPPANAITQLARPVEGLRRVLNPVAAGGGADADQPADIRKNASTSSLTLGRAVSLLDFEALAREFGGVLNARAAWAWDESWQRAVVRVWFISDGGDIAADLRAQLIGQADPNTPLTVCEARALEAEMVIDLEVESRYEPATVESAVIATLTGPESGLLALERVPIGDTFFRSRLFEQIAAVEGVAAIESVMVSSPEPELANGPLPAMVSTPEGSYWNFLAGLQVGGGGETTVKC